MQSTGLSWNCGGGGRRCCLSVLALALVCALCELVPAQSRTPREGPIFVFLFDVSASMNHHALTGKRTSEAKETRRVRVKDAVDAFLGDSLFQPGVQSTVYVSRFGKGIRGVVDRRETHDRYEVRVQRDIEPIKSAVTQIYGRRCGDGTTELYDSMYDRLEFVRRLKREHPDRLVNLYVFTDGQDRGSRRDLDDLLKLEPSLGRGGKNDWLKFFYVGEGTPPPIGEPVVGIENIHLVLIEPRPSQIVLAPFALAPRQQIGLAFTASVSGYAYELRLVGAPGCTVAPGRVPVAATETMLTFQGTDAQAIAAGRLELTPVRVQTTAAERRLDALRVPLRVRAVPAPALAFPGLDADQPTVRTRPTRPVTVNAESDATCAKITWQWQDQGPQAAEGKAQEFRFQTGGARDVRVTAVSKYPDPQGRPLQTARTLRVDVVDLGVNFGPVPTPLWRDQQPVTITAKPFGPVDRLVWDAAGTAYEGQEAIRHTFPDAGQHTVKVEVFAGADRVENKLIVTVADVPELAIESPVNGSRHFPRAAVPLRIARPEQFTDVRWTVDGRNLAGPEHEIRFDKPGDKTVAVAARSGLGGDRTFAAKATIAVREKPVLVVAEPENYAHLKVGVAQVFAIGNAAAFKPDSFRWHFPDLDTAKTGARVSHAFAEEDDHVVTVDAVDLFGTPATGEVVVRVVRPANLQIEEPVGNADVELGKPTRFLIRRAEDFRDVVWDIRGDTRAGAEVTHTFTTPAENLTVRVTAKALPGDEPCEAAVTFSVREPKIVLTRPEEGEKCVVGEPFRVSVRDADAEAFDSIRYDFAAGDGTVIAPAGNSASGYLITRLGDVTVVAAGVLKVNGRDVVVRSEPRRFVVGLGGISLVREPDRESYGFDEAIKFRIIGTDESLNQIETVAWRFGDGTTRPAAKSRETSHKFGRRGSYQVEAIIETTDDQTVAERTDVTLVARAPLAAPAVYEGDDRTAGIAIPKNEDDWERSVALRNEAADETDASRTVWSVKRPGSETFEVVENPLAVTLTDMGSYEFKLSVDGISDEDGAVETAEDVVGCVVRYRPDYVLFVIVLIICLIALVVAAWYFLGNACGQTRIRSRCTEDLSQVNDQRMLSSPKGWKPTHVEDYWSKWKKRAVIPMKTFCPRDEHWTTGAGKADTITVSRSGDLAALSFSRSRVLFGVATPLKTKRVYKLSDPKAPESCSCAKIIFVAESEWSGFSRDYVYLGLIAVALACAVWCTWHFL